MKEILKELCSQPGVSGYEDCVGKLMAEFKARDPKAKKVMVFAHMDQLGFVVKRIDAAGFLGVERLGGIPEKILPGLEVLVRTCGGKWIPGVIGNKSHHVTDASEKYKVIPIQELYVDLGLSSSKEAAEVGIVPGCPVVYKPRFTELVRERCYGTALDNRGGCAILLELAKRLAGAECALDVYLVGTVQEEYNLRGAMVACASVEPDFAIALDVAITGDTPDMGGKLPVSLDAGPVMSMYNFHGRGTLNGTIPHPRLVEMTENAAKELKIPLQRIASCGILTDASYVQLYGRGVPVIDLGFPCRYTHTAVELCSIKDLKQLSCLVEKILRNAPEDIEFTRKYE